VKNKTKIEKDAGYIPQNDRRFLSPDVTSKQVKYPLCFLSNTNRTATNNFRCWL